MFTTRLLLVLSLFYKFYVSKLIKPNTIQNILETGSKMMTNATEIERRCQTEHLSLRCLNLETTQGNSN